MFQSFETPSHSLGAERLSSLRDELSRRGVDGFLVPRADAHQGEIVPPGEERLRWLTGFTGSAGFCIVMRDAAALFVDGRYTTQAAVQTDPEAFSVVPSAEVSSTDWLKARDLNGKVIAYDPWLITAAEHTRFQAVVAPAGGTLRALEENPIDVIWQDRPTAPMGAVRTYPDELAGRTAAEKCAAAAEALRKARLDAVVMTEPDLINWLLNIRGGDLSHLPAALCNAVVHSDASVDVFIALDKIDGASLTLGDAVIFHDKAAFGPFLSRLTGNIGVVKAVAPVAVSEALSGASVVWTKDPSVLARAKKTPAEARGAREAHRRDGAAMARFLCWFDRKARKGGVTEIRAAKKLEKFRNETGKLEDISFDTISAFGPNGALPHYRVSRESNATIETGTLYLIDSGGQYQDGTTDITRTIAVQTCSADQRRMFTLVLKGMIAVSRMRFPKGTNGVQIDALARVALWNQGFDFGHGTGHGVGAYLSVHEGPQSISKRGTVALEPGMIVSNEPGYYREGAFGIRIENLLIVHEAQEIEGGDQPMLGFETLTFAPIDLRCIEPSLLDVSEVSWLDAYHAQVYEMLYPLVDDTTREWLENATAPVSRS